MNTLMAWTRRRPVLTGTALIFLLMSGLLYVQLRLPPPPDWRAAYYAARAADNCSRAYTIAVVVSGAGVPGGFEFWHDTYGALIAANEPPPCAPSWEALFGAPDTPDDLVAAAMEDLRTQASAPQPPRADLAVSRLGTVWAALNGFWVETGYEGDRARYEPDFVDLSVSDRFRAAWAVLKCDPVRGSGRPDWRFVEAWAVDDPETTLSNGPWQQVAENCASAVLSLVDSVGIGATGGKGRALDVMLHHARWLPRGDYVYAARPLVHGVWPWFVDMQDEAAVAKQYEDLFVTFGVSLDTAYGPSLALYARKILDGTEPRYLAERRWDFIAQDTPLTDDQYAYAMLMVAVEEGEAVEADRDAVAARLSDGERSAALEWAYRYFGEPAEDGERVFVDIDLAG
ncbi:hypothetical protein [Candidatus Phaeomarinobacter ectocarpi]|nr:hypothetical protein [Candidatus Phaeomarinobacter ectocarpi]